MTSLEHSLTVGNPGWIRAQLMRNRIFRSLDYVSWDRVGLWLSSLCALHCLLTPLIMLSIPFMARYYLAHPNVHLLLAILIFPVGMIAFLSGYRHHRRKIVLALGFPGIFIVSFIPYMVHGLRWSLPETAFMIVGSALLIAAHWKNLRSCRSCAIHRHNS